MEYTVVIVTGDMLYPLEERFALEVNKYLEENWKCQGGVCITATEYGGYALSQAMVRPNK